MLQLISRAMRGLAAFRLRMTPAFSPSSRDFGGAFIVQALMALALLSFLPGADAAAVKQMVWAQAQGGLYQIDAASRSLVRQVPLSSSLEALAADSTGGVWLALDETAGPNPSRRLRRVDAEGAIRADVNMKDVGLARGNSSDSVSRFMLVPDLTDGGAWAIRAHLPTATDRYAFVLVRLSASGEVVLRTTVTVPGADMPTGMVVGLDRKLLVVFGQKKAIHLSATGSITGTMNLDGGADPPSGGGPILDAEADSAWYPLPSKTGTRLVRLALAASTSTPPDGIALDSACRVMSVEPVSGSIWGICGFFIRKTDSAGGAPQINFNWLDRGIADPKAIGVAAHTDEVWLSTSAGIYALSNTGEQRALISGMGPVFRMSITPADIRPAVELVEPPADHRTNNTRPSIVLSYKQACGERICEFNDQRFSAPQLNATLDGTAIDGSFTYHAASRRASFVPAAALADGEHAFQAHAIDRFGRRSNPTQAKVVVDTRAPVVSQLSPPDGSRTNQNQLRLTGDLGEAGIVTLGSHSQQGPAFGFDVGLLPGANQVVLTAADMTGNSTQVPLTYHYLTVAVSSPVDGATLNAATLAVSGTFTGPPDTVVAVNGVAATVNGNGYRADIPLAVGSNQISVTATSAGVTAARTITVRRGDDSGGGGSTLNPPPNDPTVTTIVGKSTEFLYTGANPVQIGVAPGTIEARRAAVVRGKVTDRAGNPLTGVKVQIHQNAQYGHTFTRTDGMFDMAVNGDRSLTLNYSKAGHLPIQRAVLPGRLDYTMLETVVMTTLDSNATTVHLNANAEMQVARGSRSTDAHGTRQATVLVPKGTTARLELPDGSVRPITSLTVRATEYTVGPNGLQAMPGSLPPSSAYTYAVELSVDEAIEVNAETVRFSRPLPVYVENFLNFPVGSAVPLGYYDRVLARWVAAKNGRVVKIVSIGPSGAEIDTNGDDQPETEAQLSEIGITGAERTSLASLYVEGTTLWRAPIDHFTPWDCNWPYGPPTDAKPPKSTLGKYGEDTCDEECGSIIDVQNGVLRERVDVVGAPFSLYYSSRDTNGFHPEATITVPLTGGAVPASLRRVDLEVQVAGTVTRLSFPAEPNLTHRFVWDGKDAYGRSVFNSSQFAKVRIGYAYEGRYYQPAEFEASFAEFPTVPITAGRTRNEVVLWQELSTNVRYSRTRSLGFGGWNPSILHRYDPIGLTLHLGDGTRQSAAVGSSTVWTVAGTGTGGHSGDGGPATEAQLTAVVAIASDGKGSLVFTDRHRIRRIRADGTIETLAGGDSPGFAGDGGPAASALLNWPRGVAVDPSGNIWISDAGNHRVRMITPNGLIHTVVGSGTPGLLLFSQFAALSAPIGRPAGITITKAGEVFILAAGVDDGTGYGEGVLRVSPDLKTVTKIVAGGYRPSSIASDAYGNLAIVDGRGTIYSYSSSGSLRTLRYSGDLIAREATYVGDTLYYTTEYGIYRWNDDRNVTRVVGTGRAEGRTEDGAPATGTLVGGTLPLAFDGEGIVFFDSWSRKIRRLSQALPNFSGSSYAIPSRDGSQVFEFDAAGRHLRTVDALRGSVLHSFDWDERGRLLSVRDANGSATTFDYDERGELTRVVSPDSRATNVTMNSDGLLASITNPAGHQHRMEYRDLLLTRFERPRGFASTMEYDADGYLIRDVDALGSVKRLSRVVINSTDHEVVTESSEGVLRRYKVERLATNGDVRRTNTSATGLTRTVVRGSNGVATTTHADGTVVTETEVPDVRFGMLAPVVGSTIRLPSGLVRTTTASRLRVSGDVTETMTVNGKSYRTEFSKLSGEIVYTSPRGRKRTIATDEVGRPVRVQIDGLDPYTFEYDSRGRVQRVVQGEGAFQRFNEYTYDADGLKTATDAIGQSVLYRRDLAGRVEQMVLPGNRMVVLGSDGNGNPRGVTPPGQPRHAFEHDPLDLETSYAPPVLPGLPEPATRLQYNRDRQLLAEIYPDGTRLDIGYEATTGRLKSVSPSLGAGQAVTLGYSASGGQLTTVATPDASLTMAYDGSLLKSLAMSGSVAGSVSWTYDNNFRVKTRRVNGVDSSFSFDDDGLLTQAGQLVLTRDPRHGMVTATALGSIATSQTYSGFGEPHVFTATRSGNTLYRNELGYDRAGRIVTRRETVDSGETQYEYGYDAAGRLALVKRNGVQTASYGYDGNGNRTHVNGQAVATFDAQDRLQQQGSASYEFTANGALRRKTQGALVTTFQYDAFGNLRSVALPLGRIEYLADGLNRRIGKKVNGVLVQGFVYEGQLRIAAELDGNGVVIARFTYGLRPNVPEYMDKGGVAYRVITDHLGSVRLVVNAASGEVAQRIDYDEWGQVTSDSNPGFQPFGYAGGLHDKDTGLVRFGARDYDPQVGRWTAKDPIRFRGGDTNLYAYVGGSPLTYIDPRGLNPVAGAMAGAEIGTIILPGLGTVVGAGLGLLGGYLIADQLGNLIFNRPNTNPLNGIPGSEQTCGNKKGNDKQTRRYGPDGYPQTDTDWDHSHDGLGAPHAHDWGRPADGGPPTSADRGPGRPVQPGDPGVPK